MLDERVGKPIQHKNCVGTVRKSWKKSLIGIKLSFNTKFPHPTRFSFFSQILRSVKPIQHFIQHGKNAMLDEMLDWFAWALKLARNTCFRGYGFVRKFPAKAFVMMMSHARFPDYIILR